MKYSKADTKMWLQFESYNYVDIVNSSRNPRRQILAHFRKSSPKSEKFQMDVEFVLVDGFWWNLRQIKGLC